MSKAYIEGTHSAMRPVCWPCISPATMPRVQLAWGHTSLAKTVYGGDCSASGSRCSDVMHIVGMQLVYGWV